MTENEIRIVDKVVEQAFDAAITLTAARYAFDEENFSLEKLSKIRDNYAEIIKCTEKFGASTEAKMTLLAIEAAIDYRIRKFKKNAIEN